MQGIANVKFTTYIFISMKILSFVNDNFIDFLLFLYKSPSGNV